MVVKYSLKFMYWYLVSIPAEIGENNLNPS
jgi:hypothetical protein